MSLCVSVRRAKIMSGRRKKDLLNSVITVSRNCLKDKNRLFHMRSFTKNTSGPNTTLQIFLCP